MPVRLIAGLLAPPARCSSRCSSSRPRPAAARPPGRRRRRGELPARLRVHRYADGVGGARRDRGSRGLRRDDPRRAHAARSLGREPVGRADAARGAPPRQRSATSPRPPRPTRAARRSTLAFLPLIIVTIPLALLLAAPPPCASAARLLAAFAVASGLLVDRARLARHGRAARQLSRALGRGGADRARRRAADRRPGPPARPARRRDRPRCCSSRSATPGPATPARPSCCPASGASSGQLLPPGAGGQALRTTAYFDASALAQPLLVLAAWALAGAGPDRARAARAAGDRGRAAAAHTPRGGPGMSRNRARAAAGSGLFFAIAPGVVAGAIPYALTGWRGDAPPALQSPACADRRQRAVPAARVRPLRARGRRDARAGRARPNTSWSAASTATCATRCTWPSWARSSARRRCFGRPALLVWAAVAGAAMVAFVRLYEEPALAERFGDEYERYRREVPGWWPRRIEKT